MSERLQQLLDEGVRGGVFPMAQAVVVADGRVVFEGSAGGATNETLFDLASLTKVISTTSLFMKAWASGKLGPETKVAKFFPAAKAAEAGVTVADLLFHRSGLPAFVPYFARVMPAVPELFMAETPRSVWDEVRAEIVSAVFAAGLRVPPGREAVYSDVGFIQLGEILGLALGGSLDELFSSLVASPLGLSSVGFRRISSVRRGTEPVLSEVEGTSLSPPAAAFDPSTSLRTGFAQAERAAIAPTGLLRPREPAPGQEKMWEPFPSVPSAPGEVDDDNAWVLDGVAGHAGLFGTARDVARFGAALLGDNAIAPSALWSMAFGRDAKTPGSSRAMGFDTPDAQSSAGRHIGDVPPGAVGHLGFTGTSLWIDRGRRVVVALLTNRVALGRGNILIRQFRPRFHDAVIESL